MPKKVSELTALEVKHLGMGMHNLGGVKGLYLRNTPSQSVFLLRYSDATGRHDFSLGNYPEMSLKQARKAALEARELINRGESPIEARQKAKQAKKDAALALAREEAKNEMTFERVAEEWIQDRVQHNYWARNNRGEINTRRKLEKYVYPYIGRKNIEEINAEMVRDCLRPIWQSLPSTAKKAKSHIFKIFQWAIALHKREKEVNPASWDGALAVLMEPLQNDRKPKQNQAACDFNEIPRLFAEMKPYFSISARACEFAILTAARSKAVRFATWDEFDLEKGIWTIPLEHDKIKVPNRDRTIFLSKQAIDLLKKLPRFAESLYVFPSSQGSHLSDTAMTMFLRGLHEKRREKDGIGWIDPIKSKKTGTPCTITIHGTARASFRTWAKDDLSGNNRRFDQEAVELCLLHAKNDAYEGAYDRAPLANERRKIMSAWGKYCLSQCND